MKTIVMYGRYKLMLLLMISGLWGCAGQPFDPPQTGEIPKGPGVFTKSEDGVVLYDSNKKGEQPAVLEKRSGKPPAAAKHPPATSDYEDFEAYQQWLQWKKSAPESGEYKEFQQWREWQQYKDWKKSQ